MNGPAGTPLKRTCGDKHKDGDGYVSYDSIDEAGRKALADKVNALRLHLAQLTAAIVQ